MPGACVFFEQNMFHGGVTAAKRFFGGTIIIIIIIIIIMDIFCLALFFIRDELTALSRVVSI